MIPKSEDEARKTARERGRERNDYVAELILGKTPLISELDKRLQ